MCYTHHLKETLQCDGVGWLVCFCGVCCFTPLHSITPCVYEVLTLYFTLVLPLDWQPPLVSVGNCTKTDLEREEFLKIKLTALMLFLLGPPACVGHHYLTQRLHSPSPLKSHILPCTSMRSPGTSHSFFSVFCKKKSRRASMRSVSSVGIRLYMVSTLSAFQQESNSFERQGVRRCQTNPWH